MKIKKLFRTLVILSVLMANIACDQISKTVVRQRISMQEELKFLNEHVTLTKIENTGAFLSLGHSLPAFYKTLILHLLPLILLGFGLVYVLTKRTLSFGTAIGICFVTGGGLGNLYDRMMYGSVTDFLHVRFGILQTGIFNLADVSIMVGAFMLLAEAYLNKANPAAP